MAIVVSAVLEQARTGRADRAPAAEGPVVVIADSPSISSAATSVMALWEARLDSTERSAERSADLLVECVTAYEAADDRATMRMSALDAAWAQG